MNFLMRLIAGLIYAGLALLSLGVGALIGNFLAFICNTTEKAIKKAIRSKRG